MKIKYNVSNMHCTGCENRIKNSLKMIKGVKSVLADYNTGEVIVELKNEKVSEKIKELLNNLEFPVTSEEIVK
ncbi:MAG TPA: heavy-metal-associated domain-containing protein [Candidatus Onthousia excrementipullorum]|uniref:Heavy-metal-associated domain-containing protein n=1 Tax=Candidatus Onthousia excrementipullorum TaxID=2840884 RepID=A0A9D1DVR7_9FIRM|nr:heavy-metal-associated domain-containing protein [Candidatus Onthousia excrementipullorum]